MQHLFHAGIIVRSFHGADLEFPVIAGLWFSFFVNDHGSHGFETTDVRNIKSLHPGNIFQPQKVGNLLHGADGAPFFPPDLFPVLSQDHFCISFCQFHQFLFGALFRHPNTNPASPATAEPLLDQCCFLDFLLDHDLLRDKGGTGIKLFDKTVKDLTLRVLRCHLKIKMIPSYKPASSHKKHLYHSVTIITCHSDHIFILSVTGGDLLLLGHLLHTTDQFPIFDGLLKIHAVRSNFHFLFQHFKHRFIISV